MRSKLPPISPPISGSIVPCKGARCKTCANVHSDPLIVRGNTTLQVKGHHNCGSTNLVYLLRCRKGCPEAWYVGETEQTLRQRMNGHRATIRNGAPLPVAEHFGSGNHSSADLQVSVLVGGLPDLRQRLMTEQRMIERLGTQERGLNRDRGFLSHYL